MKNQKELIEAILRFLKIQRFYEFYPQWEAEQVEVFLRSFLRTNDVATAEQSDLVEDITREAVSPQEKSGTARELVLRVDGAARGNPGPAGIGVVIQDAKGQVLETYKLGIGRSTNNFAEYTALLEGLKLVSKRNPQSLTIFMDSELVVKQIKGEYKVKHPQLKTMFVQVNQLLRRFPRWKIEYVPREQNRIADRLANEAIDEQGL